MAPPVELKTISVPCRRAASSTRIVPATFTSASCSGRSTDTRTSTCAARWKQTSAPSKCESSGSRMSASSSRAPSGTFSRLPLERSSRTSTSSPRARSASTTCDPMNPAPPVTIARKGSYPRLLVFVTFEGLDGSGKSTQARLLAKALRDVVCDRYLDSSLAYQGIARGLGLERVLELNLPAIGGVLPDRTFLLLVDPNEAARRLGGGAGDRIEREAEDFRRRVDAAYRELAAAFPERIVTLDGTRPPEEIAREVHEELRQPS